MEDFAGQTVRGYQILERIGSGGYGVIYKALQSAVGREVAIKIIQPEFKADPQFVERFESEAQLIANLEHPHIVPLYDYWHDDKGIFLVMRYLRGGSLRDAIKQQGSLSLTLVQRVVEQIADALAVAHNAGVAHRDIKPDNILLDQRGNAYLTDFGIARHIQHMDDDITDPSGLVGTPAYVSPEEIRGEDITSQADIYSFGVLIYELLVGEHPFPGATIAMMFTNHLSSPLPNLHEKRPDLSPQLDQVIKRATMKQPAERYPDILALAVDFRTAAKKTRSETPSVQNRVPTLEERYRQSTLANLREFWIEGVLENSLYGAPLINLKMEYVPEAIRQAKNVVLQKPMPLSLTDSTGILDVYDAFNGKMLLLGEPGGGKTTRLLEVARALLGRAEADDAQPIPIVLNLSSWSERRKAFDEWLVRELIEKYQLPDNMAQTWVTNDRFTLLLDGLDEVQAHLRNGCIEAINFYRQSHGLVDIVVSSRIEDYNALTARLSLNGAIVVRPLEDTQIFNYLATFGPKTNHLRNALQRDQLLREMSRTPLMLNIMAQVYQEGADIEATLPEGKQERSLRTQLFEQYIDFMIGRRQAENPEERAFTKHEVLHYLSSLGWQMAATSRVIFYIEYLSPLWLPTNRQVWLYRTLAVLSNAFLLNLSIFGTLALIAPLSFNAWLVILLIAAANIMIYFMMPNPFQMLSLRPAKKEPLINRMLGIVKLFWLGGIIGAVIAFALAQWSGNPWSPVIGVIGFFAGMLAHASLIQEGQDFIAHYVLRYIMFAIGLIPRRFGEFLDYAVHLSLLRKVGTGYIFMHRYLLEYFADLYMANRG